MSKSKQVSISTLLKQHQVEIKAIAHLIEENIKPIKEDCQAQADHLKERQDVSWDCYDIKNWSSMVDSLTRAEMLLKKLKGIKL